MHFQNLSGIIELTLFVCAAVGLDLAELSEGALELTGKALAVNTDVGESTHVFPKCQGHGEGGLSLRMVGVKTVFHFNDAEREEIGFDSGGAVHPPGGVDEGLDELGFSGVFGVVFIQERLGMALISRVILGGEDDGLTREAVAPSVEGGALFTGFGTGAGGFLGVGFIYGGAVMTVGARDTVGGF